MKQLFLFADDCVDLCEGKTQKMEAWFEIVKGGRILHLKEGSVDYTLFKEK